MGVFDILHKHCFFLNIDLYTTVHPLTFPISLSTLSLSIEHHELKYILQR